MVITHLILNDMLKIKSEICQLAPLLQDPDSHIRSLVDLFFHEVNKKDKTLLFNLVSESIIQMTREGSEFEEATIQVFLEKVLGIIPRDRNFEALITKLCKRLGKSANQKECRMIAFTISLISLNEKCLWILNERFEKYRRSLKEPFILKCFTNALQQKHLRSDERLITLVTQLEKKLERYDDILFYSKGMETEEEHAKGVKRKLKKLKRHRGGSKRKRRRSGAKEEVEEEGGME